MLSCPVSSMEKRSDGNEGHWNQEFDHDADGYMNMMTGWDTSPVDHGSIRPFDFSSIPFEADATIYPVRPPFYVSNPPSNPSINGASAPRTRPVLDQQADEQAALRQNRLDNWNLVTDSHALPAANKDDGDASCKSSQNGGTCPSHCGKPGQGSVCCNDDDCEQAGDGSVCCDDDDCEAVDCDAVGTVCSDEQCKGAGNPCDDEECMMDMCPQTFSGPLDGNPAVTAYDGLALETPTTFRKQAAEVAAAAALTSFTGHPSQLQQQFNNSHTRRTSMGQHLDESYFDFGGSSFQSSPNSSFSNTQSHMFSNVTTSPYSNPYGPPSFQTITSFNSSANSHGFDNYGDMLMSPNSTGNHMLPQQLQQLQQASDKSYLAYTSHVLNYHDPMSNTADHGGQCFVNNATLSLPTSCPLPLFQDSNGFGMHQAHKTNKLNTACGFTINDPQAFQQHILAEHHDLKGALPASNPCNFDWTASDPFTPGSQASFWNLMQDSDFSLNQFQGGPIGPSAQTLNTASTSQGMMPTPALSPSPTGSAHDRGAPSLRQSSTDYTSDSPVPTYEAASPAGKLMSEPHQNFKEQPRQPCQCMWLDDNDIPCNQWFESAKDLDTHCRQDHVKPMEKSADGGYLCRWQMCPRRNKDHFPQRGKLNRHLQVHTGLKPNVCPFCGLAVSAKQALDQHIRLHTNETPYGCPWEGCTQKFKQRSALTMHFRTHTGEKPLICDICGQCFRESSNLTKHRRTHDPRGAYECEICDKDFNRLDQLRRHLQSNHKDQPGRVSEVLRKLKPGVRQAPLQARRQAHRQNRLVTLTANGHGAQEAATAQPASILTPKIETTDGQLKEEEDEYKVEGISA